MSAISTNSPEALIELDRSERRGLRIQLEDQMRWAIRSGRLPSGTTLPSSRALAADLGITRGVVVAAYDQLRAEGYVTSRAGSGTVVSAVASTPTGRAAPRPQESVLVDFRPGLPDLELFPRASWARAARRALQTLPREHLGYTDPRGLSPLRDAVADYLGRVRGVNADASRVVICNGFAHGLSLAVEALGEVGYDSIAVEDPGHDLALGVVARLNMQHPAIRVDTDGLVVERLRRSTARTVIVTPAHQYPTGALLPPARRTDLVAWAGDVDGYIIEDDYDAEYRFDGHPVGALQGVAPDRVIYGGTLSKSLAPGVRLGWLVVPPALVGPVAAGRLFSDHATSSLVQATYCEFLTNGDLGRHLRRARRVYRQRRDELIAALARWLPDATVGGIAAGLHLLVTLPEELDEADVVERALSVGVRVYPLGAYRVTRSSDHPPALVLGYGQLTPAQAQRGVRLLADAIAT